MTKTMSNFRCWTVESVRQTVFSDIGALPTDTNALFMAAHTPMELQHLRGHEVRDGDSGERQVLNALLGTIGDISRNTLIAVTGGSGAGKSHVVRWVHANLDHSDDRYHVLYVPRAVQTIRQLLKRIVEGLPGGGGTELMERVDAAVGTTTPAELRDRLLAEIRLALTWALEPAPARDGDDASQAEEREMRTNLLGIADERGKRRNGLADLVELPQVNRTLLRSGGLLERFTDSVYRETSSRGDQQKGFTEEDLPLHEPGMRRALRDNSELRDLWKVVAHKPGPALQLLNEALARAAPRTLGFRANHGETLDSLFRQSRQLLRVQNKELVLLFEDLVQFGLIDGELYDQFTTQPGGDMAPLRVVFAVTNDPYDQLGETVRTRITHRFAVHRSSTVDRNAFVARYLNLVRVGRAGVESDWAEETEKGGDWLRNACETREDGNPCRFRDQCHAGFGTVDVPQLGRVGLYPYNEVALRRALNGRGGNATPRDILDVYVIDELVEADTHIGDGTYPHARVRQRFDFTVQRAKDVVLGGRTGEQAERLYRALVLWGDETDLSPVVAEAFSIQLPSQEAISSRPQAKPEQPRPEQKPKQPDSTRRVDPLHPLYQWQNGEELPGPDADEYRSILHKMVGQRLNLDQDLFHAAGDGTGGTLLKKLFPSNSFVIVDARGRKPAETRVRFDLTRSADDVRVLIAAKWFADHGDWHGQDDKWRPAGYEPLELMLTLEHRLDQWAEEVRRRFLREVGGRGLARAAVGLRAVALLALGTSPDKLKTLSDVLGAKPKLGEVVSGWEDVDRVARDALDAVSAVDLIANFAAVRQGDGGPQLVDAVGLSLDLKAVLLRPFEYLRRVGDEIYEAGASVINWARKLATAVDKAVASQLLRLEEATAYLASELDGREPKGVAQAAKEVGKLAIDNNFFRPASSVAVEAFHDAADVIERLPTSIPLAWRGNDDRSEADQVLAAQGWAGAAIRGAQALATLKNSMEATHAECVRNDGTADDLEARTRAVRMTLGSIRRNLEELSTSEDDRG